MENSTLPCGHAQDHSNEYYDKRRHVVCFFVLEDGGVRRGSCCIRKEELEVKTCGLY